MGAAERIQAGDDLAAYCRSLDVDECIGEINHTVTSYLAAVASDVPPSFTAPYYMAVIGLLSARLEELGHTGTMPGHDGVTLHSCTLLARIAGASA